MRCDPCGDSLTVAFTARYAALYGVAALADRSRWPVRVIAFDVGRLGHTLQVRRVTAGLIAAQVIDDVAFGYISLISEHPGDTMSVEEH
jgi:hypothetical protein